MGVVALGFASLVTSVLLWTAMHKSEEKSEQRVCIKFMVKTGKSPIEVFANGFPAKMHVEDTSLHVAQVIFRWRSRDQGQSVHRQTQEQTHSC